MFGDEVESISRLDHVSMDEKRSLENVVIFPAKHYLVAKDVRKKAVKSIKKELKEHLHLWVNKSCGIFAQAALQSVLNAPFRTRQGLQIQILPN